MSFLALRDGETHQSPSEKSAGAQVGWEEEENGYNLCYVFPHSFARYEANQQEFKFILSAKRRSEIVIPPMFMLPE